MLILIMGGLNRDTRDLQTSEETARERKKLEAEQRSRSNAATLRSYRIKKTPK